MEKVLRQKVLPDSVRIAKACGDIETLRELGRRGAAKANRRRPLNKARAQQAARKQAQAVQEHDAYVDTLLAAEHAREVQAGAYAHAQRNRVGWIDES